MLRTHLEMAWYGRLLGLDRWNLLLLLLRLLLGQTGWSIVGHRGHSLLWGRKLWNRTDAHLTHVMPQLRHSVLGW